MFQTDLLLEMDPDFRARSAVEERNEHIVQLICDGLRLPVDRIVRVCRNSIDILVEV